MNLVFFGSFQHYSALVLKSLLDDPDIQIVSVVTTPPAKSGRSKTLVKNPVHLVADQAGIPVFTPKTLDQPSLNTLLDVIHKSKIVNLESKKIVDFFITCGYGKLIPADWLTKPRFGSLNLHFSLLPKFRGANPAEWAILLGETKTGVSLIEMAEKFDTGAIISKQEISISPQDTRETLYQKLYTLGAKVLPAWLTRHYHWQQKKQFFCQQSLAPEPQPAKSPTPQALRFSREDGFIDWRILQAAMAGKPFKPALLTGHLRTAYKFLTASQPVIQLTSQLMFLSRASRALSGFPSLWTAVNTVKGPKRLKIISFTQKPKTLNLKPHLVQLEGLAPATFNQIKNQLN